MLVGVGMVVVVTAVVALQPLTASASARSHHRVDGVRLGRPASSTDLVTSPNWSGYVAAATASTGGGFDQVGAQWTEPRVSCSAKDAWTLFWVGFDGWPASDQSVEQGGTSAQCVDGVPRYRAFYEMWPASAVTSLFPVAAGDRMTGSVVYSSASQLYLISVTDDTSGRSVTESVSCPAGQACGRQSAEWVAESPSHFGTDDFFPLAPYGDVTFTSATATDDLGHSGSIADPQWSDSGIERVTGGTRVVATVSPLVDGGGSFAGRSTLR
jgi:hypothetical protein